MGGGSDLELEYASGAAFSESLRCASLLLGDIIYRLFLLIVNYWRLLFSHYKTAVLGDGTGIPLFHFAWVGRKKELLQFLNDIKKSVL